MEGKLKKQQYEVPEPILDVDWQPGAAIGIHLGSALWATRDRRRDRRRMAVCCQFCRASHYPLAIQSSLENPVLGAHLALHRYDSSRHQPQRLIARNRP